MARKLHNEEAGYIAERTNPYVPGTKVVIYVAADQGMDVGAKYALNCDAHGQMSGATSIPNARVMMKAPCEFCTDCRAIAEA